ncbi:immune inhibitor A domain-containing protein [Nocardioides sp. C4-1]|uniref:immune inhibitor A domain-containing protein n=1 Tax=Nocardioides sp. C4-1 TaxID=3151851 RepID=UPI00326696E2
MRRTTLALGLVTSVTGLALMIPGASTAVPVASASPIGSAGTAGPDEASSEAGTHVMPNPLSDKQTALREQAVADVISGAATPQQVNGTTVVKTGREQSAASANGQRGTRGAAAKQDQYVQLENEGTDRVFVLLVEFGNQRHPDFPDADVDPAKEGPVKFDGPAFNEIPKPGPDDNSTGWQKKYTKKYYRDLYFGEGKGVESLKTYYEKQSSGRYSVDGDVTAFVKVPYNEARYGRPFNGTFEGASCTVTSNVCSNTWALLEDGMKQWVADQKTAGKTDAQIKKLLATYDQQDRYDFDGDGNFNEPDGYIDRFQIIHAGGDEADGDPIYGEDAIWSHRWYARYGDQGRTGPADNKLGGIQIPGTGIWMGDYTIQPENGGLSVVAHEYGHDLGLPDHYDTAASGDNPVSWWTIMAQSRVSAAGDQGLGTRAADLGAWDKLQLGWLDYETVVAGQNRTLELGPHEYNSAKAQAVTVVLPDKQVSTSLPAPSAGSKQWWSGAGDGYTATMSRTVAVPAAGGTLTAKVAYNIEEDYDYAFVEVQDPAGSGTWTSVPTTSVDPDTGSAAENGIDGLSATYKPLSVDLAPYAGKSIGLRVRYSTDGAVRGQDPSLGWSGILVDEIKIVSGSTVVLDDGAETSPNGWTLSGFTSVGASFSTAFDQFYLASNRSYVSWDKYLQTGPYNFGDPARPDYAEHFPYQDGLLVTYWDTSYSDNNTSQHPGSGLILPIDANPRVNYNLEGQAWRGRIQNYDAPFGLQKSDSFNLSVNGKPSYIRGADAVPLFDDSNPNRYYQPFVDGGLPRVGVKTAGAGVKIRVLEQNGTTMKIRVN